MKRTWKTKIKAATGGFFATAFLVVLLGAAIALPSQANAVSMTDYTWYPLFLSQNVPPNILFIVDLGNATIPAAYDGANSGINSAPNQNRYPISFCSNCATTATSNVTSNQYAANVTLTYAAGQSQTSLIAVDINGNALTDLTATTTTPADTFNPSKSFYGAFDPLRCYGTNSNSFIYGATKTLVTDACAASQWDGNFLNWLTMRKKDVAYQVLIGGTSLPASSNTDGTANALSSESVTGQNGTTDTCASNGKSCWRYIKFVSNAALAGHVPATLPSPVVDAPAGGSGGVTVAAGLFFGSGEGKIYVNDDHTANPFDNAPGNQYIITVDLTTEPDVPSGTGSISGNCNELDPLFAGHLICYKRDRSLGLFQKLRLDSMHVGIMFANAGSGQAGQMQFNFDDAFNAASITGIRNQHIQTHSPLSEALYEGLCLYRLSQGPCYNNSGSSASNFPSAVGAAGDPFFFVCLARDSSGTCTQPLNKTVSCCKSFVLMISPGIGDADGNTPDLQRPFKNLNAPYVDGDNNLFAGTNIGVVTSGAAGDRLDDIANYGRTHDIRNDQVSLNDPPNQGATPAGLPGNQYVTFYAINAMGGVPGSQLLASAAKFGGFLDRNNDNQVDLAATQTCTYPAGSNLGTGTSTSNPEWDLNRDCIPDTYFEASEGGDLLSQINAALADILKRAASGTSASVLASSSTGEGALYQSYFFPSQFEGLNEIKWSGFTQGLFVDSFGNIREDYSGPGCTGPPDGKLVLEHDCIIKLRFDSLTNEVKVDRYQDLNGDGAADTAIPFQTVTLKDISPIWEAGGRLAYLDPGASCPSNQAGVTCRRILTWTDTNNDKRVDPSETIEFKADTTASQQALCPYLASRSVLDCNSSIAANQSNALLEATNLIKFIRGEDGTALCIAGSCLRDRKITVTNPDAMTTSAVKVWKLGDIVDSTPTVVGTPLERYDAIYGDTSYGTYFVQYQNRRRITYAGANDGMLHAFNSGFYVAGDDLTTPEIEHGRFLKTPPGGSGITTARAVPPLGAELWAFIPQELLPHLKWYAEQSYTHVAYVDLKPKVTDVRVFCDPGNPATGPRCLTGQSGPPSSGTSVHPGGWGTVLIGGMRFGGSCGNCTSGANNGGPPMTVTADFNSNGTTTDAGDTRTFYSAYFILDITDPEQDPKLLWVFTDSRLGLTTGGPAIVRVNPLGDTKTDNTNAQWLVVFGSGTTGYTGNSTQVAKFFAVDLAAGPTYSAGTGAFTGQTYWACSVGGVCDGNSFLGDLITLDSNLDYRVDMIYAGSTMTNSSSPPAYIGKMYHLATGATSATGTPTNLSTWGITSSTSTRIPTVLLATFTCAPTPCTGSTRVGPITSGASVSADNNNNIWVFFGTGRFFSQSDKSNTDPQYYFGVKDPIANSTSCTESTTTSCQKNNLLDVSNVSVCLTGVGTCGTTTNQVTGIAGITDYSSLTNKITNTTSPALNMDGWFVTFPTAGERSLSKSIVLGGMVFFTTFTPDNDICSAGGTGNLYSLYYLTGGAYSQSTIGTSPSGANMTISRSISLGNGLPSQMAVQIGAQGTGTAGGTSSSGCTGHLTGYIQSSTGVLGQVCGNTALGPWSRLISWREL